MTPIGDQANEFGVVGYCDPFVMCLMAGLCLLEVGVLLEVFLMLLAPLVVFRCGLPVGFAACFEIRHVISAYIGRLQYTGVERRKYIYVIWDNIYAM